MTPTLIQHLELNGMTDYEDQILLGTAQKIPELEAETKNFLQKWPPSLALFPTKHNPFHLISI